MKPTNSEQDPIHPSRLNALIKITDVNAAHKTGDNPLFLQLAHKYLAQDAPEILKKHVARLLKEADSALDSSVSTHNLQLARIDQKPCTETGYDSFVMADSGLGDHRGKKIFIAPAHMSPRNTTRYRAHHLAEALRQFIEVEIIAWGNLLELLPSLDPSLTGIIIQRLPFDKKTESLFHAIRRLGFQLTYDIDDLVFEKSLLEDWRAESLPILQYKRALAHADAVFVSTKRLRRYVEQEFKIPSYIINNLISQETLSESIAAYNSRENDATSIDHDEPFVIGLTSGSATHSHDNVIVLDAVARVLSEFPSTSFTVIGDVQLPSEFQSRFESRIKVLPKTTPKQLPKFLSSFSVNLIPLASTPFNECKSNIKFLEASIVGVPSIASCVGQQSETILHMHNGLICGNSSDEWYQAIKWCHNNKPRLRHISQNAKTFTEMYFTTYSAFQQKRLASISLDVCTSINRASISLVIVAYNPIEDIRKLLESIECNVNMPCEVLVASNRSEEKYNKAIREICAENNYLFVETGLNLGKAVAANFLFRLSSAEYICGLDDDYIIPLFWDIKMAKAAKSVQPLGWLSSNLSQSSSGLRGLGKSSRFMGIDICRPSGVGGWNVFTRFDSMEYIGFYIEHGLYGGIDGDYNRRARELGLVTGYVRSVVGHHKINRESNLKWELHKQKIQDKMRLHGKQSDKIKEKFVDFFANFQDQDLSCNIYISTSEKHDENVWGDTHYANNLAKYFKRNGVNSNIVKHESWQNAPQSDVSICLFGLHKKEPCENSLNILWIISHVDKVDRSFLLLYDFIVCSSHKVKDLCDKLAPEIKSLVLEQASDPEVFFPSDQENIFENDVVFVGNSRRIFRSSVRYAVESGYNCRVWGTKWEQFIDKKYIAGQSLGLDDVAHVYRSSKIVLNDHWNDQIEFGLCNNRILDIILSGSLFLSDFNEGILKIDPRLADFCFYDKDDFRLKLNDMLSNRSKYENTIRDVANIVAKEYSFERRSCQILDIIKHLINTYVDYKSEYLWNLRNQAGGSSQTPAQSMVGKC